MVKMKRISDFPDFKNCIVGYFKIRTTRVKNVTAEELYQKFTKRTFVVPELNDNDLDLWLRYQAHIFLMDEFKNSSELFSNLYAELVYNYNSFYKRAELEHFKEYYPEQLFFNIDTFTAPLRTLVTESGYPNRILCYCFNYLITGWNPQKIVSELSNTKLDDVLNQFISQYVLESEINKLFVDYMFLPLRKSLNETLNYFVQKYSNDDEKFLDIVVNILHTRTGSTKLEDYFGASELPKRAHMISVWCTRIKNSIFKNIVRLVKNQDYYITHERRLATK